MITPVRIQRRRVKGFDLQVASLALNGLPVRYVGRPTQFGNPWQVTFDGWKVWCVLDPHFVSPYPRRHFCSSQKVAHRFATWRYRRWIEWRRLPFEDLRGHNLACWCPLDRPCHADVLLEIANGQG